ncbi:hypothetical protein SFRURICE_007442 [Spodoptera frugiperda]|uniref:SFRICE_013788 n=1 Tax=Spodoptera frugiperda TaxID=7108 RepID=A0A2H1VBK7_SPOFR|nr:hypothetical protein SFRURICE_007442 [Spodoptera frugiperda]
MVIIDETPVRPPKPRVRSARKALVDTQPVCCDPGCIWFCSVIFSIITVGMCYYLAYTLLADTKLRFAIFMP